MTIIGMIVMHSYHCQECINYEQHYELPELSDILNK
jgi:hypothetical protein